MQFVLRIMGFSSKLGNQMSFKAICEENTKDLVMFNECL